MVGLRRVSSAASAGVEVATSLTAAANGIGGSTTVGRVLSAEEVEAASAAAATSLDAAKAAKVEEVKESTEIVAVMQEVISP